MSDPRDRTSVDARDVFMRDLDLPGGPERPLDPRTSDLRHLKESGLVQVTPAAGTTVRW